MRVFFSPGATNDLTSIFLYLDARSKAGARNVMRAIHDSIPLIAEHPQAWPATDVQGVRVKSVHQYPFKIFYRILADQDEIEIVHIRHGARRPWQGGQ
jgi:plasmid stabilization system protein ParE